MKKELTPGVIDFDQLLKEKTTEFLIIAYREQPEGVQSIYSIKTDDEAEGSNLINVILNNALISGDIGNAIKFCHSMIEVASQSLIILDNKQRELTRQN